MNSHADWLGPTTNTVSNQSTPDVLVRDAGTLFTFCPLTERAKEWIADNVQSESWQWFGNVLVVERRYALALLGGIAGAGMVWG